VYRDVIDQSPPTDRQDIILQSTPLARARRLSNKPLLLRCECLLMADSVEKGRLKMKH
jgi:hypothetical protein